MKKKEYSTTLNSPYHDLPKMDLNAVSFGDRLREIRKNENMTQDEFAKKLGTSKQVLSRYETGQRIPKISLLESYAEKLGVSLEYLMGSSESATSFESVWEDCEKPFYKKFIEVTMQLGLDIPGIVRVTGLTDKQVRTIITHRMQAAPLPIALQLSDTLGLPLETWTGTFQYQPQSISVNAREVARAYDQASLKDQNTARMALGLELIEEGKRE